MGEYTDISSMSTSIPHGTGQLSQADDHMRGIKTALKNTFPSVTGVVTASTDDLNSLTGYNSGIGDVNERFVDLEAYFNYTGTKMTVTQMSMLWDLETNSTVESRLGALEGTLSGLTLQELAGLQGYNIANGTIESRLQNHDAQILAIQIGPAPSLATLQLGLSNLETWADGRNTAASNSQLSALATYVGGLYGGAYTGFNLGNDFLTVTNKIAAIEQALSGGYATGFVTWKNYLINLLGGVGGIQITNTENTRERFGFTFKGLEPGTYVDFRFYAEGAYGDWCSEVNPNKLVAASPTGEAHVDLSLGGSNDLFGPGGTRIVGGAGKSGTLEVKGLVQNISTGEIDIYTTDIPCAYYEDDQAPAP